MVADTTHRDGGGAATTQALRHDPGVSLRWSPEEQSILDDGLAKYASESMLLRYAKIASLLPEKTVRDVALRCRWLSKKESSKKKKDENNLAKKNKDRKSQEKSTDASSKPPPHLVGRPNAPPYSFQMLPVDDDDDVSYDAIGGPTGKLLEHNSQILNQISSNFMNMQGQENISLLCQARDNILAVLNEVEDAPDIMKQMPPIPVKLNEEYVTILPKPATPMQT